MSDHQTEPEKPTASTEHGDPGESGENVTPLAEQDGSGDDVETDDDASTTESDEPDNGSTSSTPSPQPGK